MNLDKRDLLQMYKMMLLIRRFEERCVEFFKNGEIRGSLHPALARKRRLWGRAMRCGRTTI